MSYEKLEQLYEGKAKKVFATSDPNVVIVSYKDDATAFNGLKKGTITGKGALLERKGLKAGQKKREARRLSLRARKIRKRRLPDCPGRISGR